MINKKHIGQGFEDFLQEEGIYEQVQLNALKKTLAHQIKAMMEERAYPKQRWQAVCTRADPLWTVF